MFMLVKKGMIHKSSSYLSNVSSFNMKAVLTIIACVALASCSSDKRPVVPKVTKLIEGIDTSGMLHHLGGMLINDHQLVHVTHWPTKVGQSVFLVGKDKKRYYRNIIQIEDLGKDLCILTLDKPVNLNNHTIIPIAEPIIGARTTALRFEDRPRRGTSVAGHDRVGRAKLALTPETYLEPGDSGKAWIQIQDGKMVCVGLNSTTSGFGPPVYKLLYEWVDNDDN